MHYDSHYLSLSVIPCQLLYQSFKIMQFFHASYSVISVSFRGIIDIVHTIAQKKLLLFIPKETQEVEEKFQKFSFSFAIYDGEFPF